MRRYQVSVEFWNFVIGLIDGGEQVFRLVKLPYDC